MYFEQMCDGLSQSFTADHMTIIYVWTGPLIIIVLRGLGGSIIGQRSPL